ncbi:MAG: DNA-binding transcriptional regulator, partial [Streptosporangiaceae bacterium]
MLETSARLLRLLSLLQMPRDWTGPQLAKLEQVLPSRLRHKVSALHSYT